MSIFFVLFLLFFGKVSNQSIGTTTKTIRDDPLTDKIILGDLEKWEWSTNEIYPKNNKSDVHIYVSEEYEMGLIAIINYINLDGIDKDFLLIKSGKSLNDEGEGNIFTYKVKGPKKIYFNNRNIFGYFQKNDSVIDNNIQNKGFSIIFQRIGDLKQSTTPFTTTTSTPKPNVTTDLKVNVSGATAEAYSNRILLNKFKISLVNMATLYCTNKKIHLAENITIKNVKIKEIITCPFDWPDNENCAQITIALPLILKEKENYELKTEHLREMWETLAGRFLPPELSIYTEPDKNSIIFWWLITMTVLTIIFIIVLWVINYFGSKIKSCFFFNRRRELSDTDYIVESKRSSFDSLGPHYYQDMPPIFENAYTFYKP